MKDCEHIYDLARVDTSGETNVLVCFCKKCLRVKLVDEQENIG